MGAARRPATEAQLTIEPPPASMIAGYLIPHARPRPGEVDGYHPVPVLHGALGRRLAMFAVDACGIECRVEAAICRYGPCHGIGDVRIVGHIAWHEGAFAPWAQLRLDLGAGFLVDVGERHRVATTRERLGRGPSDARTRTGHENDLLMLHCGHCSSFLGCRPPRYRAARLPSAACGRSAALAPSRSMTTAPSRMTARSASLGRASSERSSSGIAVDDDQVRQGAGFDHPDPRRRIHQQLAGIARAPAQHVCRLRDRRFGRSRRIRGHSCRPDGPADRPP